MHALAPSPTPNLFETTTVAVAAKTEQEMERRKRALLKIDEIIAAERLILLECVTEDRREYAYADYDLTRGTEKWWEEALRQTAHGLIEELLNGQNIKITIEEVIKIATGHLDTDDRDRRTTYKDMLIGFSIQKVREWFGRKYGDTETVAWNQCIEDSILHIRNPIPHQWHNRRDLTLAEKLAPFFNLNHDHSGWKNGKLLLAESLVSWSTGFRTYNLDYKDLNRLTSLCRMAEALSSGQKLKDIETSPALSAHIVSNNENPFKNYTPNYNGVSNIRFYKNGRTDIEFDSKVGPALRDKIKEYVQRRDNKQNEE